MSKRSISKRSINNDRVSHQEQKDIEKALRQSLLEAKARSTSKTKSHKQRSSPRTLKIKSPITGLREKQDQSVVKEKGASPKTIVKIKSPITTGVRGKQEQSVVKEKGPSPKTKQKDSKANNGEVTTDGSSKPSLRPSSAYVPPPPLELMKEDIFAILSDEDETSSSTSDIEFTSGSYKKKKNAESTTKISRKRKSKSDDCLPAKKKAYTKEKVQSRHALSSSKTLSGDLTRKNGKKDASSSSSKGRSLKGILKKDPLMYVISNDDKLITKTSSPAQSKRTPSPRIQKKLFKKTPSPSVGSPFSTTPVKKVLSSFKSPKTSSLKDTVSSSTPPNKKTSPHHRKTPPPAIAKKTACGHIKKTPIKKTLKKTPIKIKKTPVKKSPSSSKKTAAPANTSLQTIPESKSKKSKSIEETDTEEEEKEKQVSLDEAQNKIVESTTPPVERSPLSICGFQAQRKFPVNTTPTRAISSSSCNNNVNEIESVSSISDELLVAKEVPKTEDFLLYLCLRSSNVLPKELSFFDVPWTPPQFSKQTRASRQIVHQPLLSVAKKTAAKILF